MFTIIEFDDNGKMIKNWVYSVDDCDPVEIRLECGEYGYCRPDDEKGFEFLSMYNLI